MRLREASLQLVQLGRSKACPVSLLFAGLFRVLQYWTRDTQSRIRDDSLVIGHHRRLTDSPGLDACCADRRGHLRHCLNCCYCPSERDAQTSCCSNGSMDSWTNHIPWALLEKHNRRTQNQYRTEKQGDRDRS